jgi:hypothetical protein
MEVALNEQVNIYFSMGKYNSVVLSPLVNYTDRAIAADSGCNVVSATSPSDHNFDFLDLEPLLFHPSSSSDCSRG